MQWRAGLLSSNRRLSGGVLPAVVDDSSGALCAYRGPPHPQGPSTPSRDPPCPRGLHTPQGLSTPPRTLHTPHGPSIPPGALNTPRDPPHPPGALKTPRGPLCPQGPSIPLETPLPPRDLPTPPQGALHFSRPSHIEKMPREGPHFTQPPWSPGPGLAASRTGKSSALVEGCGSVRVAWGETRAASSGRFQE